MKLRLWQFQKRMQKNMDCLKIQSSPSPIRLSTIFFSTKIQPTKNMKTQIYKKIASLVQAIENCKNSNNAEWQSNHETTISDLIKNTAPSGSGIDCGTKIDFDSCTADKLVFHADFHHMNDGGFYDGWTSHEIIVTPSLAFDFNLKITSKDRNEIKEYLHDVYSNWLSEIVEN